MKQRIIFTFFFAFLLLMAGCDNPEFERPEVSHTLTGILERKATTKTHFEEPVDGIYYPFWTEKDELAVYIDGLPTADRYTLTSGAGSEKGYFAGKIAGDRYLALYPYSDRVPDGLQDNVLKLKLPDRQTYAPHSIGEGAFPMLATGDDEGLSFKNLCSVLKISMTGSAAVKEVRFVAHDTTMAVCGPATVRTDYAEVPELVMSEGGSPRVTLDCPSVQLFEDEPTDFFIVIPSGTYRGGFSVEIETFSGTFTRTVRSDVTFGRSQFRYIAPFRCDADDEIDPDNLPYNQIWYVSISNDLLDIGSDKFDRNIVSHTYENGKGVLLFDGPVTRVGRNAFSCSITEIHLPNSVETIENEAFYWSMINEFRTPEKLKEVAYNAFIDCNELKRIYGPHASSDERALILEDGTMVAYAYGALEETLVLPEGAKTLEKYLFRSRGEIRNLILPEGLLSIREWCFNNCPNLETVTFPESLEDVEDFIFENCPSLREFKGNCALVLDSRCIVDKYGYMMGFAKAGVTDYVIPEGVTHYLQRFNDCPELRSLTFPESLKYTMSHPFRNCGNLAFFYGAHTTEDHHCLIVDGSLAGVTTVLPSRYVVPGGYEMTEMFFYVFSENKYVEHLSIPDEVKFIFDGVFSYMPQLKSLQLSSNLTSIGNGALMGTDNLDTLYLRSYAPPIYNRQPADEWGEEFPPHEGLVICVPEGTELIYKSAPVWSDYAEYIHGYHYDDLAPLDYYLSTDYSRDGRVSVLQTASEGRGIDIVLMGDGFTDRQLADGTYDAVMHKMAEAFFSEEPYTTYRNLFNVYAVDVVSATEGYEHPGQALAGWFGDGTLVGGNDTRCLDYALRAVPEDRMENTLIIVAMNSPAYGGTCYMYGSSSDNDYGCGTSVAYFPVGETDEGLAQLVHHEAGGHGFAKLDDEYAYQEMGEIPEDVKANRRYAFSYGWWKNVDFTNDPETVKWSYFLKDSRYQYDGLGLFEGACTYWRGAWRPTENSIMRYNTGGFNAPSREAIWYRIHKLAYGDAWTYNYEDFVAYDAVNRKTSASSAGAFNPSRTAGRPTAPPVVVGKTWQEAYRK